jgi:DNA helicase-2/ATP-dependent DNA helicase PcrA
LKNPSLYQIKKEFYAEFKSEYQHRFTFLKSVDFDNPTVYDLKYIESLEELHPSLFFHTHANLQIKFPNNDIEGMFEYLRNFWEQMDFDKEPYEYEFDDGDIDIMEDLRKQVIQINFLFHQQWTHYKEANQIFEFNDLLLFCYNNKIYPSCKILIMDEFQDFSPLQYEVFKIWSDHTNVSIIAGDPNQAIYGFQNSSPQFLMDFEATEREIILDVSFRLPPKIIEVAQKMITSNSYLDTYQSHVSIDSEGTVESVDLSEIEIDPEDTVFVLCRTNSMVESVSGQLRKLGILNSVYPDYSMNSKEKNEISKYYEAIHKLVSNSDGSEMFNSPELKLLMNLSETPQDTSSVIVIGKRKSLFPFNFYKQLERSIHTDPNYKLGKDEFLDNLDLETDEILPLVLSNLSKPAARSISKGIEKNWNKEQVMSSIDQVKVMTIHKSKGKEADLVIVMNRATHYEKMGEEEPEEEKRIWYVAVTRARKKLVIASYDVEFEYPKTKYIK